MPLSDKERSRRYREKRKMETAAKVHIHPLPNGEVIRVYNLTAIAKIIAAAGGYPDSAVRATLKAWVYRGIVPATGLPTTPRVFNEEQKELLFRLYLRHRKMPMTTAQISIWLAARWSPVCN